MKAEISIDALHSNEYDVIYHDLYQRCLISTLERAVEHALGQMCGFPAKNILCKITMIEAEQYPTIADLKRTRTDENPD